MVWNQMHVNGIFFLMEGVVKSTLCTLLCDNKRRYYSLISAGGRKLKKKYLVVCRTQPQHNVELVF